MMVACSVYSLIALMVSVFCAGIRIGLLINGKNDLKVRNELDDNIFENLTEEERNNLWMYMIFNKDKIIEKTEEWTKEAEKVGMTLTDYLESISPLNDKEKLSWLGKNCKDCCNEKCKKLGTLPKGYDCALWQSESEE